MVKKLFISYAASDRDKAKLLVDALKQNGFDVWWDQNIPGGARYETEIEAALHDADLVIVGWSEEANNSDWVRDEAEFARNAGKLFPVSFDGSLPPIGFRQYQVEPYPDRVETDAFPDLIDAVKAKLENRPTPKSGASLGIAQRSKSRWLPGIILAVGALAVIFWWNTNRAPSGLGEPLVMIMDSAHPARIYDDAVRESGGTNADILSDILSDLPIRTQKELISPVWHRNEAILQFDPDLIVIHYSGFKQEDASGSRPLLKLLIEYFAETDTEFLIYSRAGEDWLRGNVDKLLEDLYASHPGLKSRVEVFPLLEYGEPHWRDPGPAQAIKLEVKAMLEFQ